jgi:hypothetical protein
MKTLIERIHPLLLRSAGLPVALCIALPIGMQDIFPTGPGGPCIAPVLPLLFRPIGFMLCWALHSQESECSCGLVRSEKPKASSSEYDSFSV